MRILCITLTLLSCLLTDLSICSAMSNQKSLGEWTHYYAYADLTHVLPTSGGKVFALSSDRIFALNTDGSVEEYNTLTGMTDYNTIIDACYIRATNSIMVVYSNGNIDLIDVKSNRIYNIPGILNETTNNNKLVQGLCVNGKNVYLAMDYGVVVINTQRHEVADTYRLDVNGRSITDVYINGNSIYLIGSSDIASYSSTIICASLTDNLVDKEKWAAVTDAAKKNDIIAAVKKEKQTRTIYDVANPAKKYAGLIEDTYNNCYWGSNDNNNLMKYAKGDDNSMMPVAGPYRPYGPSSNNIYNIMFLNNKLYTVSFGFQASVSPEDPNGVLQGMNSNGDWDTFEKPTCHQGNIKHNYNRPNIIAVDPRDSAHVMLGGQEGVYEFYSGKFVKHFNSENSPLKALNDGNNINYQMVIGLTYDEKGVLWVLNSYCTRAILKMEQTGPRDTLETSYKWETVSEHPEIDRIKPYSKMLQHPFFGSDGHMWFINNHYYESAFYRYDTANDDLIEFNPSFNQDKKGLYDNQGTGWIHDIAEDNEGNIWIAGTKGIAYLPKDEQDKATTTVVQHKINRDDDSGYADYLLGTVDASCILFDSSNRMYVSTLGNGVYVISPDRQTEEYHYTTNNSYICSNNVRYMALDDNTGELYISTDKGLCSVRTKSIQTAETLDENNVVAYPNPVSPDYTGPITIKGLTYDADIKITTATGAVVHSGRSNAGLYQWDGCDHNGNRVASGVYNILLTTSEGDKGCVAKVAIIK